MEDDIRCKDDLKACRMLILSSYKEKEENSQEILSVALLSPACMDLGCRIYYPGMQVY